MLLDLELNALGESAVDDQMGSRGVAGCRAGEEDHAACNIIGTAKITQGKACLGHIVEVGHARFNL